MIEVHNLMIRRTRTKGGYYWHAKCSCGWGMSTDDNEFFTQQCATHEPPQAPDRAGAPAPVPEETSTG